PPRRAVKAMRAESMEAEDSATAVTWVASTSAVYAEIVTTRADSIGTGGTAAAGFVVSISAAKAGGGSSGTTGTATTRPSIRLRTRMFRRRRRPDIGT